MREGSGKSGQSAAGITVSSGGTVELLSGAGGTATLILGAIEIVDSGYVQSGVSANGTYQVQSGGQINVSSGQSATAVTVNSGGVVDMLSGATGWLSAVRRTWGCSVGK